MLYVAKLIINNLNFINYGLYYFFSVFDRRVCGYQLS